MGTEAWLAWSVPARARASRAGTSKEQGPALDSYNFVLGSRTHKECCAGGGRILTVQVSDWLGLVRGSSATARLHYAWVAGPSGWDRRPAGAKLTGCRRSLHRYWGQGCAGNWAPER